MKGLFEKYDVPAPRYTSYPTVPYWSEAPSLELWLGHLREALSSKKASWSLYIHIPYCETLCTFCGCNNIITKDHGKGEPYVKTLLREFSLYLEKVPDLKKRTCSQVHFGGGTPTFLSPRELAQLSEGIFKQISTDEDHFEGAVEVDPRRTTKEQLEVLGSFGFNRISLGVQDFDFEVQRLVNRIQSFDSTAQVIEWARALNYQSVNMDLIYGLAKQSLESIEKTTDLTIQLKPDRIALYSFALVPWIKPAQRLFKDEDLPQPELKRRLYERARGKLLDGGYCEVGMDHFALPEDGLVKSMREKKLHRNFMGYTDVRTDVLLGLGVSSISETPWSFHQNEKIHNSWEKRVLDGEIPTFRGHVLSERDRALREQILQFMTEGSVKISQEQSRDAQGFLREMHDDGLVEIENSVLRLTEKGKPFLRNACMFFDDRLRSTKPETRIFSQSI